MDVDDNEKTATTVKTAGILVLIRQKMKVSLLPRTLTVSKMTPARWTS